MTIETVTKASPLHLYPMTKFKAFSVHQGLEWAKKGGVLVLDQGLFSGANLLLNILVARWLPREEYGAFAIALSVFYFIAGLHSAVLTEPMMVLGAGKYRDGFPKYLRLLLYGHWAFSALIVVLLGLASLIAARCAPPALSEALSALAIASPFLLLLWFVRRACYIPMLSWLALVGSSVNLILVIVGAFVLRWLGVFSLFSAFLLIGAVATMVAFVTIVFLLDRADGNAVPITMKMVVFDHRSYGTWGLLAVVAYWMSSQIIFFLIPIFLGLAASAVVAAVWNLYRPLSLFLQSLGSLLLPSFSRWITQGIAVIEMRRRVLELVALFGSVATVYGIAVTMSVKPIFHFLYNGKYEGPMLLVGLFGVVMVAGMVLEVFLLRLKASGQVRDVLAVWSYLCILVSLAAVPSMQMAGLEGALSVFAISYVAAAAIALKRVIRLDAEHQ